MRQTSITIRTTPSLGVVSMSVCLPLSVSLLQQLPRLDLLPLVGLGVIYVVVVDVVIVTFFPSLLIDQTHNLALLFIFMFDYVRKLLKYLTIFLIFQIV